VTTAYEKAHMEDVRP